MIHIRQLTKVYTMGHTQVQALAGVDLDVPVGACLALMGSSGSGKSTLLNLIGGLDRPTDGVLEVEDRNLGELDENALAAYRRQTIGFIFQSFNLVSTMTAVQNVEFPMIFAGLARAERRRRARYLLEAVGLGKRLDHRPTELSGGEQQRVSIARSLTNFPRILLADEPTGNLDSRTGGEIMEVLMRVHRESAAAPATAGRLTMLIVTHDPIVAAYADRVLQMKDGKIII